MIIIYNNNHNNNSNDNNNDNNYNNIYIYNVDLRFIKLP